MVFTFPEIFVIIPIIRRKETIVQLLDNQCLFHTNEKSKRTPVKPVSTRINKLDFPRQVELNRVEKCVE